MAMTRDQLNRPPVGPAEPAHTVLMVLYFFPPIGGVSTSRNVRNVEHLPGYGWAPVVLTPGDAGYELKDESMLDLVPAGTTIIRTRSVEAGHVRPMVFRIGAALRWRRLGRSSGTRSPSGGGPPVSGTVDPTTSDEPSRLLNRIRRLVFFPDDQIGWLPFALAAAMRRYHTRPFEVVYSTSSPITSHIVAGIVKQMTGVPWVAEFRDPWLGTALSKPLPWLHRRLKARLERWIIRSADRVVFLAPSTARMYQRRYPEATHFVTIPNGYDRSEVMTRTSLPGGTRRFRIVYTGMLFRPLELSAFLEGLDVVLARRPELAETLAVDFFGTVDETCQTVANRLVTGRPLSQVVHFRGFVPRNVALQAVADADAALVLLGAGHAMGVYIPGKVFDYLGQNRQILAMIPRGDTWDLLEELGWGVPCEPNPTDVEQAIERLLTLPPPIGPADPEGKYDRRVLAGRLADTFRAAIDASQRADRAGRRILRF